MMTSCEVRWLHVVNGRMVDRNVMNGCRMVHDRGRDGSVGSDDRAGSRYRAGLVLDSQGDR